MSATEESLLYDYRLWDIIKKIDGTERISYIKSCSLHLVKLNNKNETLLHAVAKSGDIEMTKILLEAGSEVNAQDKCGKTPIMVALECKPQRYLQVIEVLCNSNANIHLVDRNGKSAVQLVFSDYKGIYGPVHKLFFNIIHNESMCDSQQTAKKLISLKYPLCQAVLLRNPEVIEQMIIQGCSIDGFCSDKFTALSKAVQLMDIGVVQVLVKYGVDVDTYDQNGYLPIYYYGTFTVDRIQQPEIIKILLNKSVLLKKDLHKENLIYNLKNAFQYGNKDVIRMLLEFHNDILNIRDSVGQTPLHYLCANDLFDVTELLQGQKINADAKDKIGCTPLWVASQYLRKHVNMFELLLKNNADVNAICIFPEVQTPLFFLCQSYSITEKAYFEIIYMFLQYNLDIQFVGLTNNTTVFDIIIQHKKYYMSKPLLAHLAIIELKMPINECIRNKIHSHNIFKNCFNTCKNELLEMKNNIINENLTLYDIIANQMTEEHIINRCRFSSNSQSKFENILKASDSNSHYHNVIQKRISSIILKLRLLLNAAPILCEILKFGNPCHIAVTEILNYLDNEDLQNIIKV